MPPQPAVSVYWFLTSLTSEAAGSLDFGCGLLSPGFLVYPAPSSAAIVAKAVALPAPSVSHFSRVSRAWGMSANVIEAQTL